MSNITTTNDRFLMINDLRNGICSVSFTKKDGTVTTRMVTMSVIPFELPEAAAAALDAEYKGADLQNPRANIVVWDVTNKHLISFYADRVTDFRVLLDIL